MYSAPSTHRSMTRERRPSEVLFALRWIALDLVGRLYRHHGEGSPTERGTARLGPVDHHIKALGLVVRRTQDRNNQTDAVSAVRDLFETRDLGRKVPAWPCRARLRPPSEACIAMHVAPASNGNASLPVGGFDIGGVRSHFYANRPRICGASGCLARGGPGGSCGGARSGRRRWRRSWDRSSGRTDSGGRRSGRRTTSLRRAGLRGGDPRRRVRIRTRSWR